VLARAQAHPNIALVKYWGKQPGPGNFPAVPSLSITLDSLIATTEIATAPADSFTLNGKQFTSVANDLKLTRFLKAARQHHDIPPLAISSSNNFPTAAGLASSAAGFAALVTALDVGLQLGLSLSERSALARIGSASAARSVMGGFVGLIGPDYCAEQIAQCDDWPLAVVIAITQTTAKEISSTDGMQISAQTSPYYQAWLASADADYEAARRAINERNFEALAQVSEHSCLKMHALMLSSQPSLGYWNPASLACIQCIRTLQQAKVEVFFTIDAGPQVKAICTAQAASQVQAALTEVQGVLQVQKVALGAAARVLT